MAGPRLWIPGLKGNNLGLELGQISTKYLTRQGPKDNHSQVGWWGHSRVNLWDWVPILKDVSRRIYLQPPTPNTTSQDPGVPKSGSTLDIFGKLVQFPRLQKILYSRLCLEQMQPISHVKPGMGILSFLLGIFITGPWGWRRDNDDLWIKSGDSW